MVDKRLFKKYMLFKVKSETKFLNSFWLKALKQEALTCPALTHKALKIQALTTLTLKAPNIELEHKLNKM